MPLACRPRLGLLPFPHHLAHGLGDDAGKVAAEASYIGPDTFKACFNLAKPGLDPIQPGLNRAQPRINILDLLAGSPARTSPDPSADTLDVFPQHRVNAGSIASALPLKQIERCGRRNCQAYLRLVSNCPGVQFSRLQAGDVFRPHPASPPSLAHRPAAPF
jgi:hypothetical protein